MPDVNHAFVLNLFHLLGRVIPTATVTGRTELARTHGLIFTLELARTFHRHCYSGFDIRVISPAIGQLHTTRLTLAEHRVTTGPSTNPRPLDELSDTTAERLLDGVHTGELETSVRAYVTAFAGPPTPR